MAPSTSSASSDATSDAELARLLQSDEDRLVRAGCKPHGRGGRSKFRPLNLANLAALPLPPPPKRTPAVSLKSVIDHELALQFARKLDLAHVVL